MVVGASVLSSKFAPRQSRYRPAAECELRQHRRDTTHVGHIDLTPVGALAPPGPARASDKREADSEGAAGA